jgi:2-oxoglutarate dehydrogenase E2 component (dihydrolipoamide succinyltransferase)
MSQAPTSLGERIALEVPSIGESVTEVQVGAWRVAPGSLVKKDQILVELESDKATVELPAPADGVVEEIYKHKGSLAGIGEAIGVLRAGAAGAATTAAPQSAAPRAAASAPAAAQAKPSGAPAAAGNGHVMPSAARLMAETGTPASAVEASGPGGRVLKEDVQRAVQAAAASPAPKAAAGPTSAAAPKAAAAPRAPLGQREEERVPMSMLRRKIAQNLVAAQQNAALLTTFNEIDMGAVKALREEHQSAFEAKYGIRLGFMSFFVKAAVDALRLVPAVNAEVRGDEIVYRHYQDIGVAVGGGKGLVVPVIRNAERLSFAEVEQAIADFGKRAKDNKLGSLLSTPIVNPPQSGILGLHAIQDRPVAREGQVVIRPMMYVALTYDHRLVDGREAVTFLKRIKECVENPARMLLEV